jgi:AP-2 complex subunit mu-1
VAAFVPPDGEFELMRYRCADGVGLPFRVLPAVTEVGRTRVEVAVRLKAAFDARLAANNVTLAVPVPPSAAAATCDVTAGKAKYDPKRGAIVWKVRRCPGQAEATLLASVDLVATTREARPWARPPAQLTFSLPAFAASGLRVQYLKVWEKGGYGVDKWVRKLCVAGDYAVRI